MGVGRTSTVIGTLVSFFVIGCGGGKFDVAPKVNVEERRLKDNDSDKVDVVDVTAEAKDLLKTRISRVEIVGKEPLDRSFRRSTYAAESFPVGTTKVKVRISGETKSLVRKWSAAETIVDVDVTRVALAPRARVAPRGSVSGGCGTGERLCVSPPAFDLTTGKADFSVNAPAGTKVELLGRTVVGKGTTESVAASFDLSKELLSTPIDGRIPISVKVTSPDALSETRATSVDVSAVRVRSTLDNVKKGPVRFANEPSTIGPSRVVAFKRSSTITLHGKGTLPELELVAISESLPARNMSCGTYVGQTTGRRVTITNTAYDTEVVVYERKTGKVRTRRSFRAPMPGCSSSTSSASGSGGFVSDKDLIAYVESLVGR